MIFRNLIFSALLVGMISGIIYGAFQHIAITPLILAAEKYEVLAPNGATPQNDDDHSDHSHDHLLSTELGRPALTVLSNILIGTAFSIFLIALMALHNYKSSKPAVNRWRGTLWGVTLLIVIFAAPAYFGLHPELPGTIASALEYRQFWWIMCSTSAATGIALLYYLPVKYKPLGLLIVSAPHVFAEKSPMELKFANPAPEAIEALTSLTHQFFSMTAIGMVLFCLLIGALSGFATERFVSLDSEN